MPKLLRCKKSLIWQPDEYLTSIVGSCDRGRFTAIREVEFPAQLTPDGRLFLDVENVDIEPVTLDDDIDLDRIRCANCGGPVELVEADPQQILDKLRLREIDMKRKATEREAKRAQETKKGDG